MKTYFGKITSFITIIIIIFFLASCQKENEVTILIDFEDITLPESGYLSNENANGFHKVDRVSFAADYNIDYGISSGTIISSLKDTVTAGYTNGYSAWPGSGADGSVKFAVINPSFGSEDPIITFDQVTKVKTVDVANNTYAALSMRSGDAFAKVFSFEDADFFKVIFEGFNDMGESTGTVEYYLADFRTAGGPGIVKDWKELDLSGLGSVKSIGVSFGSSDVGTYGINTPMYVAIDNLRYEE